MIVRSLGSHARRPVNVDDSRCAVQHYRSNLRDLEFNLLEVLGRDHVLGAPPYTGLDAETARDMLAEADRLARNVLAGSLIDSDRNPPRFDPGTGTVTLPP